MLFVATDRGSVFVALLTQHDVSVGPVFTNPTVKYFLQVHKNILLPTTRINLNIGSRIEVLVVGLRFYCVL